MSLCIECGCAFCCDGTMYSWATLKEADFAILDNRFDVVQEARKDEDRKPESNFRQPCKLCVNDRCSIYEERRPAICGDYQCKLVDNHRLGKVTTQEARTIVENAKKLRDRLRPQMEKIAGVESGVSFLELVLLVVNKHEKKDAAEGMTIPAEILLDIATMRVLLAKNFDSRFTKHTYLADKELMAMESIAEPLAQSEAGPEK